MERPGLHIQGAQAQTNAQILVVENEDLYRDGIAERLREAGYKVVAAKNVAEARQFFSRNRNSLKLILLDVELAEVDEHNTRHNNGFDWVAKEIEHFRGGFPSVVFISRLDIHKDGRGMIKHPLYTDEPLFFGDTMVGAMPKPSHVFGEDKADLDARKERYLRSFLSLAAERLGPPPGRAAGIGT